MSTTEKLNGYGPLAGVKVVELCEWVAAPAAVRCLSEMGATIYKVEPPYGDAQRTQGPGLVANRPRPKILLSTSTTPTRTSSPLT